MPWLGHVHALAGASGPSLIFSSLVSIGIGGGRNGSVGQTIQCANHVPSPSPTAPLFAPNASIAVSIHSRLNGLWVRNEVWEQVWEGRRAPWHRTVPGRRNPATWCA